MKEEIEVSMAEIAAILLKRWWLIILSALVVAAGAFGVTKFIVEEEYTASVSMYVQAGSNQEGLIASLNDLNYAQKIVNTYIEILRTDIFLKSVAKQAGVQYTPDKLLEMIEMQAVNNTEIFEIKVTTNSPEESLLLATTISELAPRKIIEIKNANDVKVVDPATLPLYPSAPNVLMNTAIGLALGLVLGVLAAFLIFFLDKRVKDEEDILRHYDVPILGVVPLIEE